MRKYHELLFDSSRTDIMGVLDYDMKNFDLTKLWLGEKVKGGIPKDVVLFVDNTNIEHTDYVGNPITWIIMSDKLINLMYGYIKDDVEILDVNLFNQSESKYVKGFHVINPLRKIKCLDVEKSILSYPVDEEFKDLGFTVIKPVLKIKDIPEHVHLFRLEEAKNIIIFSDSLAQSLRGKGINGVAFVKLDTT
ncbi:MAG: hypothetical protein HUU32_05470 [Calditrichaceae bacterium]|nr:hypothetical protein [Calditrichaceae bacterium]